MLKTALEHNGPICLRYPRGEGWGTTLDEKIRSFEIGKGNQLRGGKDLAILALGHTVVPALRAAEDLSQLGIDAGVINARFVKPLDRELIVQTACRVPYLLTIEDHVLEGGFGSAVVELLADEEVNGVHIKRLGIPDRFIPHGTQDELKKLCGLDQQAIFHAAVQMIKNEKKKLAR
jgi:1-deoxy-D-xylulose-5-phosphate synthase